MRWPTRTRGSDARRDGRRRRWLSAAAFAVAAMMAVAAQASWSNLSLPRPEGDFAVGRTSVVLVDPSRHEAGSPAAGDHRSVPLVLWYPAQSGTGRPASYLDDRDGLSEALVATGS